MSLFPFISRGWWDSWDYPSRIVDQHFGMALSNSDLSHPISYRGFLLRPRTRANFDSSGLSEVSNEQDKFKVMLNVSHFQPDEIEVKTVDNSIVIHAKHEEKTDEHGFISREFSRRYMLPKGAQPENVTSLLNPSGILIIEAPKVLEQSPTNERMIPITVDKPEGN